jgi:hypothetical protein
LDDPIVIKACKFWVEWLISEKLQAYDPRKRAQKADEKRPNAGQNRPKAGQKPP